MAMRFNRGWDFNPGNKQLDLNSLTQDTEVIEALQAALGLAAGGQAAADTTFTPASGVAATDVQGAIVELAGDIAAWVDTDTDDQTAAQVPFTPAAGVAATDVQGALVELAGDIAAVPAPNVLLLTAAGAVPGGTAAGTIIVRKTV